MNPIKFTPVGQTSNKEIADFGEHIMENSSTFESTISKTTSFSNVENPINHRDLLNSQILEIDKELNKFDISKGGENGEIGNPKKAGEEDHYIDKFKSLPLILKLLQGHMMVT